MNRQEMSKEQMTALFAKAISVILSVNSEEQMPAAIRYLMLVMRRVLRDLIREKI